MKQFCPALKNRIHIKRAVWCRIFVTTAFIFLPLPSQADITAKDIQVAGRILDFTTAPLTGNVKMEIVYDPANTGSTIEARKLMGIIGAGLTINGTTILATPVTIQKIGSVKSDLMFLTSGLGAEAAKAGAQAAAEKILCITRDLSATRAGDCAVSVQTTPTVQITINKAAAAASGISFVSAFMLMITEI